MKLSTAIVSALMGLACCASEIEIASSEVPEPVMTAFKGKYPQAADVEWEIEKQDNKLYYEAEFKLEGKKKEAYFRPDGAFFKEE